MFAAPILPPSPPTGWFPVTADQHRRPVPVTPGIVQAAPLKADWLTPLVAAVIWANDVVRHVAASLTIPTPASLRWIVERLVLYDRTIIPGTALCVKSTERTRLRALFSVPEVS